MNINFFLIFSEDLFCVYSTFSVHRCTFSPVITFIIQNIFLNNLNTFKLICCGQ
jgi:hypothetical protein